MTPELLNGNLKMFCVSTHFIHWKNISSTNTNPKTVNYNNSKQGIQYNTITINCTKGSLGETTYFQSLSHYFQVFKRHLPWLISILLLNIYAQCADFLQVTRHSGYCFGTCFHVLWAISAIAELSSVPFRFIRTVHYIH